MASKGRRWQVSIYCDAELMDKLEVMRIYPRGKLEFDAPSAKLSGAGGLVAKEGKWSSGSGVRQDE
jgi:hypothetical protein